MVSPLNKSSISPSKLAEEASGTFRISNTTDDSIRMSLPPYNPYSHRSPLKSGISMVYEKPTHHSKTSLPEQQQKSKILEIYYAGNSTTAEQERGGIHKSPYDEFLECLGSPEGHTKQRNENPLFEENRPCIMQYRRASELNEPFKDITNAIYPESGGKGCSPLEKNSRSMYLSFFQEDSKAQAHSQKKDPTPTEWNVGDNHANLQAEDRQETSVDYFPVKQTTLNLTELVSEFNSQKNRPSNHENVQVHRKSTQGKRESKNKSTSNESRSRNQSHNKRGGSKFLNSFQNNSRDIPNFMSLKQRNKTPQGAGQRRLNLSSTMKSSSKTKSFQSQKTKTCKLKLSELTADSVNLSRGSSTTNMKQCKRINSEEADEDNGTHSLKRQNSKGVIYADLMGLTVPTETGISTSCGGTNFNKINELKQIVHRLEEKSENNQIEIQKLKLIREQELEKQLLLEAYLNGLTEQEKEKEQVSSAICFGYFL